MSIRFMKNGQLHVLTLSGSQVNGEKIFACCVWAPNGQAVQRYDVAASSFHEAKGKIIDGNFI